MPRHARAVPRHARGCARPGSGATRQARAGGRPWTVVHRPRCCQASRSFADLVGTVSEPDHTVIGTRLYRGLGKSIFSASCSPVSGGRGNPPSGVLSVVSVLTEVERTTTIEGLTGI